MSQSTINTIEYLVLIVSEFASKSKISEQEAYDYLKKYGAFELCQRHYGVMHTLDVEDNLANLTDYCRRKGGSL